MTWKQFLGLCELDKEPMLYQHITDELFEMRIKDVVCPSSDGDVCSEVTTVTCLTFEEANAVRYVGGYVVHSLKQHEDVFPILEELTDKSPRDSQENEDEPEGPAMEWIKSIDRGGLTRITTDAYQLFYAIELCTRKYFNTNNVTNLDDKFRNHVTNCILIDENALFNWCMAGQDENEPLAQKCLEIIVELWVSVRGFETQWKCISRKNTSLQRNQDHFGASCHEFKNKNIVNTIV